MAENLGVNATSLAAVPVVKLDVTDQHGRLRVSYDEYTPAGAITLNDTIVMGLLPPGARVHEVMIDSTDLGTAGVLSVGWKANGVDAVNAAGFIASVDVNAAAINKSMSDTQGVAGQFKKFTVATQVIVTATTATTATGTIKLATYYTLD